MNPLIRLALVSFAPAIVSIPAILVLFAGYKYFGVEIQLEPVIFTIIQVASAAAAGVVCMHLAFPLIKVQRVIALLVISPLLVYGFTKSFAFQLEALDILGYSCCREYAATPLSVLEIGASPLSPFFLSSYVTHQG